MMYWWLDIVFLVGLVVMVWALFHMHQASEKELEHSAGEGIEIDVRESLSGLYPARLIRQAGMLPGQVSVFYWIGKLILTLVLPLLAVEFIGGVTALTLLVFALFGFIIVDIWLLARRQRRKRLIERSLGYFIDLIAAFLKSGMSLSQAFLRASEYGLPKENPLAREVNLLARELEAGGERESAFSALAERTGVKDLQRLAAVMNVGFRVGAPITDTLEAQSELLRAKQWEQAESLVSRKTLEALLPLLLVSLPLLMVLVFFPAAVQIFEVFQLFSGAFG